MGVSNPVAVQIDETHLTPKPLAGAKQQSCFIPDTHIQFAWDSTSLGLIKQCPRLYQYTMIDGWQSRDESIHLRFGIEFHQALQDFERLCAEGLPRDTATTTIIHELLTRTFDWHPDPDHKAARYKNRETLLRLVLDYIDKFNPDPAETYILQDGKAAVELSFRFELDWGPRDQTIVYDCDDPEQKKTYPQPYLLCGHLDRVVRFNDSLFVMDYKTTTTTPTEYYFAQFEPNNQMTLYTLASKIILNSPVKGVIINAAQILLEEPNRHIRHFTYRTADQLDEWVNDLQFTFSLAESYAENNYWPMNDTACDKFGGCRFRKICSKSPQVREQFLEANFIQLDPADRWNPLKSR